MSYYLVRVPPVENIHDLKSCFGPFGQTAQQTERWAILVVLLEPRTWILWWCSAPARLCACLWSASLQPGLRQWSPPWTPESRSAWTSHGPRGLSQTCFWCWTFCPWWHGSDPQWSSPVGSRYKGSRNVWASSFQTSSKKGSCYSSHVSICAVQLICTAVPSGAKKRKTCLKLNLGGVDKEGRLCLMVEATNHVEPPFTCWNRKKELKYDNISL